jgi:signal transduction histidine kinase/CheY-like chemotaxis protein
MKASSHIARDFPDLTLPRASDTMAGLLYVPLTAKAGQDFIVFLRKGQVKEVQWAGKPYKEGQSSETSSLEPRKSFQTWSETVTGRSRAWTDDQMESAGVLALIYGKFIQVWREKQSAMASNQLTAILLSNTSHAVRTPLSQIINTLELALSGDLDPDTRNMLENSHQASRALLFHVHDLLDLTKIETGNETAFNDPFDLRQAVNEAVRLYQTESSRRGLDFKVNVSDSLPQSVIGDARKIKTVISNLVANSVKYTQEGYIEVTIGPNDGEIHNGVVKAGHIALQFIVHDSGCGIPTEKLERMFATLEGAEEMMDTASGAPGLGLGLAVVARIVEQLGGQLRAESEVDVGSKFFFTVQMLEHTGANLEAVSSRATSSAPGKSRTTSTGRAVTTSSGSATGSGGSVVSARSRNSEIDSFVHDFGASHMVSVGPEDTRLREADARMNRPGTFPVTDSSYPVRPTMSSDADSNSSVPNVSPVPISPKQVSRPTIGQRQSTYGFEVPSTIVPSSPQVKRSPSDASPRYKSNSRRASKDTDSRRASKDTARGSPQMEERRKLRILVVEDDAINSQILQKRLKMDKHITTAVPNGQEAVDVLAKDWEFDAVLMDIQ